MGFFILVHDRWRSHWRVRCFRSTLVGSWLNFVLTFFAYSDMQNIMEHSFGPDGVLSSPFWFVLEGGIVGIIIGYFATRFGGEGKAAVEEQVASS